jgi:hypothetical protein
MANAPEWPVIGYYKVFATEGQDVSDDEAHPTSSAGGLLVQWLYPFSLESQGRVRMRADEKAVEVSQRLDGAPISSGRVRGVKNAYAIRVGKERAES